ncbi:PREDICTED: uncharacterized protein LOC104809286 isoform X2 [Tarenaya hassleriana]|uniref:uncharacterized protein LOC104809286 isoform X2 n=1 Tax=Tarenaya hassleriana TaxID=28532 RepID=UPI00053C24AE|nr:PREDICTED: uncharacterized protein LOC104809286 isoform X2 [Tarenaya hassleriana]
MKFLLVLVPCFGHQQFHRSSAADEPRVEETRSLMRTPSRRSRKRVRISGGGASAEWRPSLTSISEDRPSSATVKSGSCGRDERKVRRKSRSGSGGWSSHVRGRSEDFGASETAIPAFSPTPFMF